MRAALLWTMVLLAGTVAPAAAKEVASESEVHASDESSDLPIHVRYRKRRLEISSDDGNWLVHIQWRMQFRYSYPLEGNPRTPEEFTDPGESSFDVNRGRMKVGGHAYRPWLGYYLEYDFPSSNLLDFRVTARKNEALQLRVGQWKVNFTRERVASSGKQQFVDRSILNDVFTLDRQQGVMVMGHILRGTHGDSWYHLGVFSGTGRGEGSNDDSQMLWLGRWHWNFLGRDLDMDQSDTTRHERPAASLAFAAARNQSPYTRFSSSGGGQLPGFADGETGQYRVEQLLVETAFKYRGFSFQHESHWKEIDDQVTNVTTDLRGSYAQVGYFFHSLFPSFPEPLEFAGRVAFIDDEAPLPGDREEYTLGANWFFVGHSNKLTFDVSRLTIEPTDSADLDETRVRLQWDLSF